MYQKHSFFISGYLNSSAQLFVHLTWSNRLKIGEKQKAHFPNYEKTVEPKHLLQVQLTETFHQSFTLLPSLTYTTRSIKIKPQSSEQATKTMELIQILWACPSGRNTKATSFIPTLTAVEPLTAYTYLVVHREKLTEGNTLISQVFEKWPVLIAAKQKEIKFTQKGIQACINAKQHLNNLKQN